MAKQLRQGGSLRLPLGGVGGIFSSTCTPCSVQPARAGCTWTANCVRLGDDRHGAQKACPVVVRGEGERERETKVRRVAEGGEGGAEHEGTGGKERERGN
jgi:hypothetical protein